MVKAKKEAETATAGKELTVGEAERLLEAAKEMRATWETYASLTRAVQVLPPFVVGRYKQMFGVTSVEEVVEAIWAMEVR